MTESELLIVLNRFLSEGITLSIGTYIGAGVVTICASAIGAYTLTFFKKNAELKAIHSSVEEIKKHTDAVKKAEAVISNQSWVEQQRWLFRKELYLSIIELLIKAREKSLELDSILSSIKQFSFDEESSVDEDAQFEVWENQKDEIIDECHDFVKKNIKPIADDIALLVNKKGRLFLNQESISILGEFYNSHKTWYQKELDENGFDPKNISSHHDLPAGPSEEGYLAHYSKAAKDAYKMIITVARKDLKIDMNLEQ
ncbi:hypothetical protein [Salinivibrio kushneri]|uniref:hypothetical protein n=1 Tax=Salinivibrio kushneri TaxID=1908198 RepID=UPI000989289A|nr:hypothetical protein [Salinivibrio kushneri]OOE70747.1 hypothetical protein BZG19_05060 [Salinivibrio kushneri]